MNSARRSLLKLFGIGAAAPVAAKAVEMLPKEVPTLPPAVQAMSGGVDDSVYAGGDTFYASIYCSVSFCEIVRVSRFNP